MRIYFVRHGESEANILREISNRGYKHGLTPKGRAQAEALADTLREVRAVKIYVSPLQRAVETARILAETLGIPYEITDALREYDCGIVEGRADPEAWEQWSWAREEWFEHGRFDSKIEGGESFADMRDRFVPFVQGLVDEHRDSQNSIILISHGGLYTCMLSLVLVNVDMAYAASQEFGNTQYVLAETTPDGLICLEWCKKNI